MGKGEGWVGRWKGINEWGEVGLFYVLQEGLNEQLLPWDRPFREQPHGQRPRRWYERMNFLLSGLPGCEWSRGDFAAIPVSPTQEMELLGRQVYPPPDAERDFAAVLKPMLQQKNYN